MSIEWMGMLLLTLIFSPFTNSRHLYMLLDVTAAAGALLLATDRRLVKWPLAAATGLMAIGITFPPGAISIFNTADQFWRLVGGASWCMLIMYIVLIYTNVRWQVFSAQVANVDD
jgi:hypothetical protein